MGLLSFLFRRTPKSSDAVPEFQLEDRIAAIKVWTPANETPAVLTDEMAFRRSAPDKRSQLTSDYRVQDYWEDADTTPAEPLFCMIDYVDAAGSHTRRRITIRRIIQKNGVIWLGAHCHERDAARTFRADRIRSFITLDGEVIDCATFLTNYLDVSEAAIRKAPPETRRRQVVIPTKANFRTYTKPHIIILTATAIVDDHLHAAETDVILRFIENEGFSLYREGITAAAPDLDALAMIERRIPRLRPTRDDLADAFGALKGRPAAQINRLKRAIAQVITADGVVHLSEELFLSDLDRFLAQSETSAWSELAALVGDSPDLGRAGEVRFPKDLTGTRVAFSGQSNVWSRTEVKELSERGGATITNVIDGGLSFLVVGNDASRQKIAKADKLGIPVISFEDWMLNVR